MKISLLFVALAFLAVGLLWQNGVVDPFTWIQPEPPGVKQHMNGSVKEKSLRGTSSKKPRKITKSPKGTTAEKKRVTNRQTIPTKKPPVVKRVSKPSTEAAPRVKKTPKGAVPQKQVIQSKRPETKESKKRVVIRQQITPPKKPSVAKKTEKPPVNPFADPFKILSPKAKRIDKEPPPKKPLVISKTQTSGMNGKKPALNRNASVTAVPRYPYSLYIGSFKTLKRANKAVSIYTKKGLRSAYKVKVFLSKGVWYRVYMGYFESHEWADKFRRENQLVETTVKKTPYANLIGTYSSTTTLENKIRSLGLSFSPYVITDRGGKYRLFVGAFYSKQRAETQQDELKSRGIPNRIVKR